MWNMQSGKERRTFSLTGPPPGDSKPKIIAQANGKAKAKAKKVASEKSIQAVTGLATDTLNNVVVASTLEGKLYVRSFLQKRRRRANINSSSTSILPRNWRNCNSTRPSLRSSYIAIAASCLSRVMTWLSAWSISRRDV